MQLGKLLMHMYFMLLLLLLFMQLPCLLVCMLLASVFCLLLLCLPWQHGMKNGLYVDLTAHKKRLRAAAAADVASCTCCFCRSV